MCKKLKTSLAWITLLLTIVAWASTPLSADDRGLVRANASDPYVMILLDTSGSMNWSPGCTQAQVDAGTCDFLCPTADCFTPMNADDPASKLRQAKEALYEVLTDVGGVNFGFATYNQDGLQVFNKHWLYQASTAGVSIPGYGPWPAIGAQEVFGASWACDAGTGAGDGQIGCLSTTPADLTVAWDRGRVQRFAKGGQPFSTGSSTIVFVKSSGNTYRITYQGAAAATYGSNITTTITVVRCTNTSCSSTAAVTGSPATVTWTPISDFLTWDNGANRANPQLGYWPQGNSDLNAANTCSGWDPNTDTTSDTVSSYNLKFTTTTDPISSFLSVGDVIPLDWRSDHVLEIQRRLAPNIRTNPAATPDFRISSYFNDNRVSGDAFLKLKNSTQNLRPFMADGSTPLASSIGDISDWFAGFVPVASTRDPLWQCRSKYLVILTDGDESCSNDACAASPNKFGTANLWVAYGVKTYVIGFGLPGGGDKLTCMAVNGQTTAPIFPQNKQELVDALTNIFSQVREQATTIASAAVPSVQADSADRIYLTSFTPIDKKSLWDGHLDAYLKPLPLTPAPNRLPDRSRLCSGLPATEQSACRLWDVGEVLKTQAPTLLSLASAPSLDTTSLKMGLLDTQRRVLYPRAASGSGILRTMRLFIPPTGDPATDPDWTDLWNALGIPLPADAAERTDAVNQTKTIMKNVLGIKSVPKLDTNGNPISGQTIDYVMGDIFHADPLVVDRPNDFLKFSSNLGGGTINNACPVTDLGYYCWAIKHQNRRKMLLISTNDGQLHAVDGGIWDSTATPKAFTTGTGKELFSYMPRLTMPIVREQGLHSTQIFSLDGSPAYGEGFIDPGHSGTPDPTKREWRSLVVAGFREGGRLNTGGEKFVDDFVSGYYALDVTQPDTLTAATPGNQFPTPTTAVVPSCLTLNNTAQTGCYQTAGRQVPFPAVLWEFTDSISGSRLDEDDLNSDGVADGNATADLGQTWSTPTIARIKVNDSNVIQDKYVAIVGGGFDGENKASPQAGNFVYMIDLETGKAIYKRQVTGAIAGAISVVDTDLNGLADKMYFGTTAGFVYKADIGSVGVMGNIILNKTNNFLPALGTDQTVRRITDAAWKPFPIFDTGGRPVYQPVVPIFLRTLSRYAIGIGSGDREDLWNLNSGLGRYYMVVDDNFLASEVGVSGTRRLPKVETDIHALTTSSAVSTRNYLFNPQAPEQAGWFFQLAQDERIITDSFALSNVLVFSTFIPTITVTPASPGPPAVPLSCKRAGESHVFAVSVTSGDAWKSTRYTLVPKFLTNPYVEINEEGNPIGSSGSSNTASNEFYDPVSANAMKKMMPKTCKFGNYWYNLSSFSSDTAFSRFVSVPICFEPKNFKEY